MRKFTLLFLTLALANVALAQSSNRSIAAIAAEQQVSPVRITAITGSIDNLLEKIRVRNESKVRVVGLRIGWNARSTTPGEVGFDAGELSYANGTVDVHLNPLPAGAEAVLVPEPLLVRTLDEALNKNHASERVIVLIGISEVLFSDGTSWKSSSDSLVAIAPPSCGVRKPEAKLMNASFNPATALMRARCGLCWRVSGVWKCMVQPNYVCNLESTSQCTSQQAECDPL